VSESVKDTTRGTEGETGGRGRGWMGLGGWL
jgi:hypothetical protein